MPHSGLGALPVRNEPVFVALFNFVKQDQIRRDGKDGI